ncbi:hypothetical protein AVEN_53289-1 [Araneus ventricosus]|uniref:Uncharacterized protein n=1 Tax=Araneus ventricosus TaxID=182803 RepID=A0A4Y2A9W9_ARAVE|nr:hypothetical protein AVEN_53289-1 [Araneus ventricosus]
MTLQLHKTGFYFAFLSYLKGPQFADSKLAFTERIAMYEDLVLVKSDFDGQTSTQMTTMERKFEGRGCQKYMSSSLSNHGLK